MTVIELPVVHGIVLGGEERYGYVQDGKFYEALPSGYLHTIYPLTEEIGLMRCFAEMVDLDSRPIAKVWVGVVDGKIACTSIEALPGREITGQLLRQAPLAHLVRSAGKAHLVHLRDGFAVRFAEGNPTFSRKNALPTEVRRRTLNGEFLLAISRTYRQAVATGQPPAIAVQEKFGPTTPENARRWIAMARAAGYLGASLGQGRKGESTTPHSHPAEPGEP